MSPGRKYPHFPAPPPPDIDHGQAPAYFAVCTVIKDENADIREWVHYYHWLGANAIYVYDHGSRKPMYYDLEDWILSGVVQYSYFKFKNHERYRRGPFIKTAQGAGFQDCFQRAAGKHQWLAFFDIDEFLVRTDGQSKRNISELLKEYEAFGGLVVNWRSFGSSGHKTRPQNISTLEAYTSCIADNSNYTGNPNIHIKSIVNVNNTKGVGPTPHNFSYKKGFYSVNPLKERKDGPFSKPPTLTRLALHHYSVKSNEEYSNKHARGSGTGNVKGMRYWNQMNAASNATCLDAVQLGKECCSYAANSVHSL